MSENGEVITTTFVRLWELEGRIISRQRELINALVELIPPHIMIEYHRRQAEIDLLFNEARAMNETIKQLRAEDTKNMDSSPP